MTTCKGWRHQLWGTSDIPKLKHINRQYLDKEPTLNGKSDWLRSAILFEHGGVYIDADTQWVNNKCLDKIMILASTTGLVAALEPERSHVAPGVMAAVKHHPVMKLMMAMQVALTTSPRIRVGHAWERVGPGAVTAALSASDNNIDSIFCNKSDNLMMEQYFTEYQPATSALMAVVLSSRYFYPRSWIGQNYTQVSNVTYIAQMTQSQYPDAFMYQLGLSTNLGEIKGFRL